MNMMRVDVHTAALRPRRYKLTLRMRRPAVDHRQRDFGMELHPERDGPNCTRGAG
jgi:hypothetical protein